MATRTTTISHQEIDLYEKAVKSLNSALDDIDALMEKLSVRNDDKRLVIVRKAHGRAEESLYLVTSCIR